MRCGWEFSIADLTFNFTLTCRSPALSGNHYSDYQLFLYQTISEHRDPTVDVLESKEGNSIKIIADLPGVTKDNIKVTENQGVVNIAAENGDRKYNKNIPTGKKLDANKSKANFTNGVLELDIPLRKSEDEKNIRID